jgi:type IV pilus biogenesis protein CpaD/CtpE
MKNISALCLITVAALALSGCADSPAYVYRGHPIGVIKDPKTGKSIALAEPCPVWDQYVADGLDNNPPPQFGCSDSYNLAHTVERPADLVRGRVPGDAEASASVLGIERYREGKTKELINPKDIGSTGEN